MDGPNHYDPTTGRWTAPDPMGDAGGDPDWYGYCLDDPVNMVDPLGLWSFGGMMDSIRGAIGGLFGGKKDDERDSLDGLEKGKIPGLDKKIKDGLIGKGEDADDKDTLKPGGGRFGGGGASGTWDTPSEQPNTAPTREETETPKEVSSFMQKALDMHRDRLSAIQAEEKKAKQEQEERSMNYAKGKSDEEEDVKKEVAPQGPTEKTDIKSIAGKHYDSLTTEMANPETLDDGLGWGLDTTLANAISLGVTLGIEQAKKRAAGLAAKGLLGSFGILTAPLSDFLSPSPTNIGHDEMMNQREKSQQPDKQKQ